MRRFNDLTGKRFGMLTVLCRAEDKIYNNGRNMIVWHCKCDCGTYKDVSSDSISCGTTSCGCVAKENARERMNSYWKWRRELCDEIRPDDYPDTYDDVHNMLGLHKHTMYAEDLKSICGVRV